MSLYKVLARKVPALETRLKVAGILDEPEEYVKKTAFTAMFTAVGLAVVIFLFFPKIYIFLIAAILLTPLFFLYYLRYVDVKALHLKKQIDEEIVYAGRFLVIELSSGVPVHEAFADVQKNYGVVGSYFGEIVSKTYLGTTMEDAIDEVLILSPSPTLSRILWQLLNSIKTGSDVAPAINSVIDQIIKEQQVMVKEYGKKLNPLAMFYLMVSVIIPSLGTVMIVVIATFMNLNLGLMFLLGLAGFLAFVQFMFLSVIKSSRPPIGLQ